jgi:hypothetical protein
MPNVPGTGQREAQNPFSEALGKLKVKGKLPGSYGQFPIPETEQPLPPSVLTKAELHETISHVLNEIGKMLWYSDPKVDFIPLTLDPQVENIVRLEGRWHSGIFIQGTFPISIQVPGLGQVTVNLAPGWNALNVPEGTRLYSGDANRHPAWLGIANVPLAGTDVPAISLVPGSAVNATLQASANPFNTNVGGVSFVGAGNSLNSNPTGFWNAAVLGAGVTSPSVDIHGYGKIRIFVSSSVADTFNVQISPDSGTTWYTLTQDNAGTPLIIATTATQLTSCRDIATFGATNIRLLNVTAATVTAGLQGETV